MEAQQSLPDILIPEDNTAPTDLSEEEEKKGEDSDDDLDDNWATPTFEATLNVDASVISAVADTPAYQWLVGMVKRNMTLAMSEASVFNDIASVMTSSLKFRRGRAALQPEEATIIVHWDPERFVHEQEYKSYESLRTALVITGEALNGQMTNCTQYVQQTWPLTGPLVLEGLIAATARCPSTVVTSK